MGAHDGLVYFVANRYGRGNRIEPGFDDLVQEGRLGLLGAIRRYRANGAASLSTYALIWIQERISRWTLEQWPSIRVSASTQRDMRRRAEREVAACSNAAENASGRRKPLTMVPRTMSLDAPPDGYNMPVELEDLAAVLPERELVAGETRHVIASAVARLPDRQRSLVVRRFGLDGSKPVPQVVLAHELGVTRQRVGQIVAQAIRRLRHDPQIAELLGDECWNRTAATTASRKVASRSRRASPTHPEQRCGRERTRPEPLGMVDVPS